MNDRINLTDARWGLAKIWFVWGFLIFGIMIVQSILGKYGSQDTSQVQEAWSWFIPTIVPTLSLMIGVIGAAALLSDEDIRTVKKTFYVTALWISVAYLLTLSITILLQPFAPMDPIPLYTLSNYWLSPMQGIVGGAIGLLFTSQQREQPATDK
jgi:hypothetical protein